MARTVATRRRLPAPKAMPPPPPVARKSARLASAQAKATAIVPANNTVAAKKATRAATRTSARKQLTKQLQPQAWIHASNTSNAAREQQLTQQLTQVQAALDAQRHLHDSTIQHAVQEALRKLHDIATTPTPALTLSPSPLLQADMMTTDKETEASASVPLPLSVLSPSLPPCVLPPHWPSGQSHHVQLVTLAQDSADFQMIASKLVSTGLPTAKLINVQRIYNLPLWQRYAQARERIMLKPGNEALNSPASMGNEQFLWHGTRSNQPHLLYCNADGFDVRCASNGMLGPGMYFSRSAAYSGTSYAHALSAHQHHFHSSTARSSAGYHAPIPPLYSTTPAGKLKVEPIPPNAFQMFLARVTLGTEYDVRTHGQHGQSAGYHQGRPPVRPFTCEGCRKVVNLEKLNLDTLRASLAVGGEEEVQEQQQQKPVTKRARSAKGKKEASAASAASVVVAAPAPVHPVPASPVPVDPLVPQTLADCTDAAPADTTSSGLVTVPTASAASVASDSTSSGQTILSASSSFESIPVSCPHCSTCMGTRATLLAQPHRYDSVTSDHMSVTYESALAYPEFLLTFTR